ncbi:MAG TPA: hypothetical protein VGB59_05110 [Allosphingosinicella sp.]|jgi:hypothetical protein
MDDEIGFHSGRALAELDLARGASDVEAARLHLAEAERHLDLMRELCRPLAGRPSQLGG